MKLSYGESVSFVDMIIAEGMKERVHGMCDLDIHELNWIQFVWAGSISVRLLQ